MASCALPAIGSTSALDTNLRRTTNHPTVTAVSTLAAARYVIEYNPISNLKMFDIGSNTLNDPARFVTSNHSLIGLRPMSLIGWSVDGS
jgi:hypothetical protein